jgi:hypothetical protein
MYKFLFIVFPIAAIVITLIRRFALRLPIADTALEFQFRTLPLLAYAASLLMVLFTWGLAVNREPTPNHTIYLTWISGWAVGAVLIWRFSGGTKRC